MLAVIQCWSLWTTLSRGGMLSLIAGFSCAAALYAFGASPLDAETQHLTTAHCAAHRHTIALRIERDPRIAERFDRVVHIPDIATIERSDA